MKFKSLLPLLFIVVGIVIIGIGGWQILDSKTQTEDSLEVAKKIVEKNSDLKGTKNKDDEPFTPFVGETVGLLELPRIKSELAIIEGTDEDDLKKGVGHYKGSYYPGENGQIVLSGHRDTVFRRLGELKIGDPLKVKMPYGNYDYEIIGTKIVEADDTSIITLQKENEELVVTTCYPFSYVGDAPQRYIIYAKKK
ncbi:MULTISPECIES: class D sortase [unclassified Bacillus (in: firmicutes)]|uniref:class D sortase n=1 Tax=unclassified Bacillus (in: firmicutes) TaxID=185979 RepID=UPI0008E7FFD9|nr:MULTISPECIES: class D sortase [unclassified Bacillus (in: firmicutes)]SFB16741.1 sortase A [Bacillus sp. UNCCL13]SFQ77873.1 sortase A [Bacillus sp. cl95]